MANPHIYFNERLIQERENSVFSFRPLIEKSNDLFNNVIEPAIRNHKSFKLEPKTFTDDKHGEEIIVNVYEGINKSRLLIFDLSIDDRYTNKNEDKKTVNPNVSYELGIARSVRTDRDIILLTDSESIGKEILFDVRMMRILNTKNFKNSEDFEVVLKDVLEKQISYQDKRIESISKMVGAEGFELMHMFGRNPKGQPSQFLVGDLRFQIAALRLLDLGILRSSADPPTKEYLPRSYDWTSLGKAVIDHIGFPKMSTEEFKESGLQKQYQESDKNYRENYMKARGQPTQQN